jgi:hypothetical protein
MHAPSWSTPLHLGTSQRLTGFASKACHFSSEVDNAAGLHFEADGRRFGQMMTSALGDAARCSSRDYEFLFPSGLCPVRGFISRMTVDGSGQ